MSPLLQIEPSLLTSFWNQTVSTRLPAPSKARHEASRSMLSVPPLSFAKKPLASTMSQPTPRAIFERPLPRSEEHTSELQSLMRISYAVFGLKHKTPNLHDQQAIW